MTLTTRQPGILLPRRMIGSYGAGRLAVGGGLAGPAGDAVFMSGGSYQQWEAVAAVDNLGSGDFTVEGWFWIDVGGIPTGGGQTVCLLTKHGANPAAAGWSISAMASGFNRLIFDLSATSTTDDILTVGTTDSMPYGEWFHFAAVYDSATKYARLYMNGVDKTSTQQTSANPFADDSSFPLRVGDPQGAAYPYEGRNSWYRISNVKRYTTGFTPDTRTSPPADDANTLLLCAVDEGLGTETFDQDGVYKATFVPDVGTISWGWG